MNYYTDHIPLSLAEKLKEKGMPIEMQPLYAQEAPNARGIVKAGVGLWCPPYAEVFDWLMEKDIRVYPVKIKDSHLWHIIINDTLCKTLYNTWHEAAEKAIEKALELIK